MGKLSVTVNLRGGLGNQLFQYAAGLSKAARLNAPLYIDARQLPNEHEVVSGVSHWPEQISEFDHGAKLIIANAKSGASPSRWKQLERLLGDRFPRPLAALGLYANETAPDLESFLALRTTGRFRINSYCDSPLYFKGLEPEIRQRLSNLIKPSGFYSADALLIESCQPIAMHVRLGDYKNLTSIYGSLDPNYFASAAKIASLLDKPREIWIFSDEPRLALELLSPVIPQIKVAPLSSKTSGLETLLLMSKCHGLIASNSTYSWWAAFMMGEGKPIVFPRPFFLEGSVPEPKHLLLNSWIQIGRDTSVA